MFKCLYHFADRMATDAMNYGPLVETMRGVFKTGRTKTLAWRNSQLRAAVRCLEEQKGAMCEALKKDLKKVGQFSDYVSRLIGSV